MNTNRLIITAAFAAVILLPGSRALAQDIVPQQAPALVADPAAGEELRLFRKDLRSLKKQVIAANIALTDDEAERFWPIYDRYTAEMTKINDQKFDLLKAYATNYESITDEQADAYIKGRAEVEEAILQVRLKYMPVFRQVLSGKMVALFMQIDWRLGLMLDLQIASQVPMIEP